VHSGSPEQIVASLSADVAIAAAAAAVTVLPFGHAPAVSRRIIDTVAETVLPALVGGHEEQQPSGQR
jgi:hypothetical protein